MKIKRNRPKLLFKMTTERQHQQAFIRWCRLHPELKSFFHIPNGGYRHPLEAYNLKKDGVLPGVSDLFLPLPRGLFHGLWLEFKAPDRKNRPNALQQAWINLMRERHYEAYVVYNWDEAREKALQYLKE